MSGVCYLPAPLSTATRLRATRGALTSLLCVRMHAMYAPPPRAKSTCRQAQINLPLRKQDMEDAIAAASAAVEEVSRVSRAAEEGKQSDAASKKALDSATKTFKNAQATARKTTVQGAELELTKARQRQVEAADREKNAVANASRAKELMTAPIAEADTARAVADQRAAELEAASEPERLAARKLEACTAAVGSFEGSVQGLSSAVFTARFEQPAFWTTEESAERTAIATTERLRNAVGGADGEGATDAIQGVAAASDRRRNAQLAATDKWRLFVAEVEGGRLDPEGWAVHALLHDDDGALVDSLTLLVTDLIALALERVRPHPETAGTAMHPTRPRRASASP